MAMTLDEAIEHVEDITNKLSEKCAKLAITRQNMEVYKCWIEHRQLANWLKDYKSLLNEKVKTAKWKRAYDEYMPYLYCSNCRLEIGVMESTNYCPNCGAKMEGGLNIPLRWLENGEWTK